MKVLVQRVKKASCYINDSCFSSIDAGLLLYVSFHQSDTLELIPKIADKVAKLRIFEDSEGKMNLSVQDVSGSLLSISQFTLEASTSKGHRPSFTEALTPQKASEYYDYFNDCLRQLSLDVKTGDFGAYMAIESINDGPVTVLLERRNSHD